MSNLDLPTSLSYFRKSPAKQYILQYESPTKVGQRDTYYSKSPLTAEARQLNNYYDLKNTMELRYQGDLDKWKSRAQESELRKDILEKENLRLIEELNFWKTKNYTAEREKDLEVQLKDQLAKSQADILRRSVDVQQDLLQVEIESLRNQLHEKMKEVDEWKSLYFNQELRVSGVKQTSEQQLRIYEAQLNNILKDIQSKIDEADDLHRRNSTLLTVPSKLASAKKEVKDIRSLLDMKYDESEKLKQDMTKSQIENYSIRKNELKLREQEQNLLAQIETIQKKIENTHELKNLEEQQADREHNEMLEKLKDDHQRAKEALDAKKLTYSQLIVEKEKNLDDLRSNLEDVKRRINKTRERELSNKKEANDWRVRQKSIDILKEEEVKKIHQEREKSIEVLKNSHHSEREVLEGRINHLRSDLNQKEERIRDTSNNLARSRLARNNAEIEKRALEADIERKRLLAEEAERKRLLELEVQEQIHKRDIDVLRNSHNFEKQKLEEQEKTLNYVLDAKQKEALEQKERARNYLISASEAERKEREKSIEAELWKNTYTRTEREKSIEVEVAKDLRRSQIEALKRSHDYEMIQQERNTAVLRNVLDSKQYEVRNLRDSHSNIVHELINTSQDAKRANLEAQIWRNHANSQERDRHTALITRDIVQSQELDSLRRSQLAESQYLRQEINNLANVIDHKAREAADWRENYNRLYNSQYRR
ncbi:tetrin A (macronuclear) [Tetrahymena thermophila SB210]|uniref:Tetrin A n=1 Tax=Tetrahymena thermophila (strain SB210) TaxID=312017 RepID=Q22SA4_TETTS|nr:tetrin A [Tetrahymena thermophila SB210]EAR87868.2 tetrin A [Tetrahymena thermophila SB210]|eukprot:XP_001008113.2 tetrin A [Tetrahymena thermophila SB210]